MASTGFGMRGNEVDSRRRSCRDGDERVAMGMGIPLPNSPGGPREHRKLPWSPG